MFKKRDQRRERERGANFSTPEVEALLNLVLKNSQIIENKTTDAVTWKSKEECWENLANEYNLLFPGNMRSAKSLKMKYETFKKEIRKKIPKLIQQRTSTGVGPLGNISLTPMEEKIYAIMYVGVDGIENPLDDYVGHKTVSSENEWSGIEFEEFETKPDICSLEASTSQGQNFSMENVETVYDSSHTYCKNEIDNEEMFISSSPKKNVLLDKTNSEETCIQLSSSQAKMHINTPSPIRKRRKRAAMLARSKNSLLSLQEQSLKEEIEFKSKERQLIITKLELEVEGARLDNHIKELEKQIKSEMLKKILTQSENRL